jgi:hypothetical protein
VLDYSDAPVLPAFWSDPAHQPTLRRDAIRARGWGGRPVRQEEEQAILIATVGDRRSDERMATDPNHMICPTSTWVPGLKTGGGKMDLKEEVRRRIADLTRAAYERGYRDGAQSALAEIESVSAEDLADQLKATPGSLEALGKAAKPGGRRPAAAQKPKRLEPKRQPTKAKVNGGTPKATTVQRCIQELIAAKGEARRNEVLAAARAENPKITGQDLLNGIRTLIQRGEVQVDPEERGRLIPAEAPSESAAAT